MNINATLIIQLIVFLILVWFTMSFVWPPIAKALDAERKADLAGDDADRIEQRLVIIAHRRAAHPRERLRQQPRRPR